MGGWCSSVSYLRAVVFLQSWLDRTFKETGHQNAYFPQVRARKHSAPVCWVFNDKPASSDQVVALSVCNGPTSAHLHGPPFRHYVLPCKQFIPSTEFEQGSGSLTTSLNLNWTQTAGLFLPASQVLFQSLESTKEKGQHSAKSHL